MARIARRSRSWIQKQKSEPNCCFISGRTREPCPNIRLRYRRLANSPPSYARNDWPAKQWASLKLTGNPKTKRTTIEDATIVALAAAKEEAHEIVKRKSAKKNVRHT
jgi:hypothetical protein